MHIKLFVGLFGSRSSVYCVRENVDLCLAHDSQKGMVTAAVTAKRICATDSAVLQFTIVLTVANDKTHSHAVSQNGILRQISSVVAVVIRANRFPSLFYFLKQFHRTRTTSIAFARRRNRCRNENHMPHHIDMSKSYLQHLFPVHQHFVTDSKAEQIKLRTKIGQPNIADRETELGVRLLTSKRTLKLHFMDDDLLVKCRFWCFDFFGCLVLFTFEKLIWKDTSRRSSATQKAHGYADCFCWWKRIKRNRFCCYFSALPLVLSVCQYL